MPTFTTRVALADGRILEDRMEADDERTVRGRLEKEGVLVLSISKPDSRFGRFLIVRRGFSEKTLLIFNQELLALLRAGLPVVKTLEILSERNSDLHFAAAIKKVGESVKTGRALSDAMSEEKTYFTELYISSIRAGEKSGNLIEIIDHYISYQRKLLAVRKKVFAALSYPCFLLIVGMGVVVFLLSYVMPTFAHIYANSNNTLPGLTLFFMDLTLFIQAHYLPMLLVLLFLLIGLRIFHRSQNGRAFFDGLVLKLPVLRGVMIKHHMIQMARTLGAILKSGIPLVPAMQMTGEAMTNSVVATDILNAKNRVQEGKSLSTAFAEMAMIPKVAIEMISVGEETGALEEILVHVADFHEEALDLSLSWMTTLVEPILILLMGAIVGIILVAMYLPVFNLAGTIG